MRFCSNHSFTVNILTVNITQNTKLKRVLLALRTISIKQFSVNSSQSLSAESFWVMQYPLNEICKDVMLSERTFIWFSLFNGRTLFCTLTATFLQTLQWAWKEAVLWREEVVSEPFSPSCRRQYNLLRLSWAYGGNKRLDIHQTAPHNKPPHHQWSKTSLRFSLLF